MQVTFHRTAGNIYFSTAARDDGVTVLVPGYDRTSPVPHDLAHFVAERSFGLDRGFWGSVAAGAMFTNMKVVEGRRRPHAAERSKELLKANGAWIGVSEAVAGAVHDVVEKGHSPEQALKYLRAMQGIVGTEPLPVGVDDIERAVAELRAATERWSGVADGEGMTLSWQVPTYNLERRSKSRKGGRRMPRRAR